MKKCILAAMLVCLVSCAAGFSQTGPDSDQKLASDFWAWRARSAPYTGDDVPRLERPLGAQHDWSAAGIARQRTELAAFDERWKKLDDPYAAIPLQVDHRLIGSALARVHWELDVLKRWQKDPNFYIDQTLTAVGEALTISGPFSDRQSAEIFARLNAIPQVIAVAQQTLVAPPAPFARLAIDSLADVRPKLQQMAKSLPPATTIPAPDWQAAANRAAAALEGFRSWLQKALPALPEQTAMGRENYVWFLRNVALIPLTPEELVAQAELEWRRSLAFEEYETNRNRAVPPLVMSPTTDALVALNQRREAEVRAFVAQHALLTLPAWLQHYTMRPIPAYLAAFSDFVEADDFTGPSRLHQDGIRYVAPPSETAGYFWVATAMDPRLSIVHEGTVGHYGQLCIAWQNPDAIRRYFYDSSANEGIGFYAEEMMLQSGLYDDSPHTREIVYNQARLRALRVIVDVKVSLGELTQDQAAAFLEKNVPMSAANAHTEVVEMNEAPGQKISYQVGKLQIVKMMQEAREKQGSEFSLAKFHDFVWLNGNVPIALQRWELLGTDDEVKRLGY